ncbi:serine--tRNA ligase [Babesia bovis T2Bo]|uniref:Serine--tRNA ligase n=1 Tax=Babesia bovis TaxID=5865 RepID=A7AVA5_BABBO|nr:serine--tRNA ligase [Babesia bovis T2Bo]EDO05731.1 serine--tRNA ligase [Babesia bovis T2Bo]|eukprot:XP_001609299.1 hypothetical protein [Babesia bovis T2Bo]
MSKVGTIVIIVAAVLPFIYIHNAHSISFPVNQGFLNSASRVFRYPNRYNDIIEISLHNSYVSPVYSAHTEERSHPDFTDNDLDKRINEALKHNFVRRLENSTGYIPTSFDICVLAAVPELFHENFSIRHENHLDTLLNLRKLYLQKVEEESQLSQLSNRRSDLAKDYLTSGTSQPSIKESSITLRNEIKSLEASIRKLKDDIRSLVNRLPNIVSEDVPKTDTVVQKVYSGTTKAKGQQTTIPHDEVIARFSEFFTSKSTKIAGTGFSAFSGDISRLERALINFMLDTHHKLFGYKEVSVPFVVNSSTLEATGHLQRFENDLFKLDDRHQCSGDPGYLIPTGEIPLISLLSNTRLQQNKLPLWLMAYTPCFRAEIQDYGRETRGLIRNHQFGKVELICVCDATASTDFHELMISHIEFILESLDLPYRRVLLPANELGSTSNKTIDLEVYFPSLRKYIEVSSCSNTLDYQSNKLGILTRSGSKVHCINGSGLAIGRTLSAILENYQVIKDSGRLEIAIPHILQPYLEGDQSLAEPLP